MRLNRPASRDDLAAMVDPERKKEFAQNAAFLNAKSMKRSKEAIKKLLEVEEKGATKLDAFKETEKFATEGETGIFRGSKGTPLYELTDEDMRINPDVANHFNSKTGGQVMAPLDEIMHHKELYSRVPLLGKTPTTLIMPEAGLGDWGGGGQYITRGYTDPKTKIQYPEGEIKARARSNERDLNSSGDFSAKDVVVHETGHGIQDLQGEPGGDNELHSELQNQFSRQMHPRVGQYRDVLGTMKKRLMDEAGLTEEDWLKQFSEADQYLQAANDLFVPGRNTRTAKNPYGKSALNFFDRYQSTAGESQSRMFSNRKDLNTQERRDGPDFPWLPKKGVQNPYEFQIQRDANDNYSLPDDKDTLIRLIQGRPELSKSKAVNDPSLVQKILGGTLGLFGLGGAASASEAEEAPQTPSTPRQMTKTTLPPEELQKKAQAYTQGFRGDKPYDPNDYNKGKAAMGWDAAQSAATAGRNVIEGTAGMVGDLADMRGDLAQAINDYAVSKGSSLDMSKDLETARNFTYNKRTAPNTEEVHGATEGVLDKLASPGAKSFIDDWTAHEATTPWGSASEAVVDNLFDPMNALPGAGRVKKGLSAAARRFAR